MRGITVLSALCVLLLAAGDARAQPGRFIPMPRPPAGGGFHVPLHIPGLERLGGDVCWGVLVVVGLAVIGWLVGVALGGGMGSSQPAAAAAWQAPTSPVPPPDVILDPAAVSAKAQKTTRLLEALARRDGALNPDALREFMARTFDRVHECWEARDYGPVRELLTPSLLAAHEKQLAAMRRERLINRSEARRLEGLEFVHVCCPADMERHEVTALITFQARVYYIDERTGGFARGSNVVLPYQEFWVFRRHGEAWRLHDIERSHLSNRLSADNEVAGMTDVDRRNAEENVICL
jgi:predicted lipid-binding transport protein (Tim44 family)